jgi:hypothetical protein
MINKEQKITINNNKQQKTTLPEPLIIPGRECLFFYTMLCWDLKEKGNIT